MHASASAGGGAAESRGSSRMSDRESSKRKGLMLAASISVLPQFDATLQAAQLDTTPKKPAKPPPEFRLQRSVEFVEETVTFRRRSVDMNFPIIDLSDPVKDDLKHLDDPNYLHRHNVAKEQQLLECNSLAEIYRQNDFDEEDHVDANEQVAILEGVVEASNNELKRVLAGEHPDYAKAAKLRDHIAEMKRQYIERRQQGREHMEATEKALLSKATVIHHKQEVVRDKVEHAALKKHTHERHLDIMDLHDFRRTNLERDLHHQRVPHMKYSCHLMDEMREEKELASYGRFEEAKDVQKRIAQIEPDEIDRFMKTFRGKQEKERQACDEDSKHQWHIEHGHARRDNELLKERHRMREWRTANDMRNCKTNLHHAYVLESQEPIKFQRQSRPVVKERASKDKQGSLHRGKQILAKTTGAKHGSARELPSMTSLHSFGGDMPDGTVSYTPTKKK